MSGEIMSLFLVAMSLLAFIVLREAKNTLNEGDENERF